jgi:hypothetical protein
VDDGQVDELRRWAQGLSSDSRPEVQAAAKAITMLADDLDAARSQLLEERRIREALEANEPGESSSSEETPSSHDVERDLRTRFRSYLQPRLSRRQ